MGDNVSIDVCQFVRLSVTTLTQKSTEYFSMIFFSTYLLVLDLNVIKFVANWIRVDWNSNVADTFLLESIIT